VSEFLSTSVSSPLSHHHTRHSIYLHPPLQLTLIRLLSNSTIQISLIIIIIYHLSSFNRQSKAPPALSVVQPQLALRLSVSIPDAAPDLCTYNSPWLLSSIQIRLVGNHEAIALRVLLASGPYNILILSLTSGPHRYRGTSRAFSLNIASPQLDRNPTCGSDFSASRHSHKLSISKYARISECPRSSDGRR